jgi:hypothetical protein
VTVSFVRFINNKIIGGQYNLMLSALIIISLAIAVIWTYLCLIKYFISFFTSEMSNRNITVNKVFNNDIVDHLDKDAVADEE